MQNIRRERKKVLQVEVSKVFINLLFLRSFRGGESKALKGGGRSEGKSWVVILLTCLTFAFE